MLSGRPQLLLYCTVHLFANSEIVKLTCNEPSRWHAPLYYFFYYRALHPNVEAEPGYTWPAKPDSETGFDGIDDRIDFIYLRDGAANRIETDATWTGTGTTSGHVPPPVSCHVPPPPVSCHVPPPLACTRTSTSEHDDSGSCVSLLDCHRCERIGTNSPSSWPSDHFALGATFGVRTCTPPATTTASHQ